MLRWGALPALGILVASPPTRVAAHEGWGIVVHRNGSIYVADIPANTIWRVSRDGRVERVARGKHSHALVIDSAGTLYGTNPHLTLPIRSVWRLDADGQLSDVIAPTQNFPLGLQSFIIDAVHNIYSVNARNAQTSELQLLVRSVDGHIATLAGSTVGHEDGRGAAARFTGIDGIASGPDGALYVTDGPYVRRVGLDGAVTTLGTGPLTERRWDEDLLGIAVDAGGDIYVADHANRRILRVTQAGVVNTVRRTGWLWTPTGIALAPDGMYLLEHLRMPLAILGDLAVGPYLRVRMVATDGSVSTLATMWGRNTIVATIAIAVVLALVLVAIHLHRRRRRRYVV
jgi:sugar lactone lactonase YvrE